MRPRLRFKLRRAAAHYLYARAERQLANALQRFDRAAHNYFRAATHALAHEEATRDAYDAAMTTKKRSWATAVDADQRYQEIANVLGQ
jgi:hypothetical protein